MKTMMRVIVLSFLCSTLGIGVMNAYGSNQPGGAIAFAKRLQTAVANNDSNFVAEQIAYPIDVYFDGSKLPMFGAEGAEDTYADWMTPYLYSLITKTSPAKLVKVLDIRKEKDGVYKVHDLLLTGDPADFRYSKDGIYSAKGLMQVLAVLRKGATEHCAKCVAKVIEYPIWECIGGKSVKIKNEAEFLKHYDEIVTPEVKDLMLHAWERHNWTGFPEQGVMLGSVGDIWIGSFGHKDAQGFYVWETKVWALREVGSCPAR